MKPETHKPAAGALDAGSHTAPARVHPPGSFIGHADLLFAGLLLVQWVLAAFATGIPDWRRVLGFTLWTAFAAAVLIRGYRERCRQLVAATADHGGIQAKLQSVELRMAERTQQLASPISLYQALLENINAVPWAIDLETGTCLYVGPQAESLWGWPPSQFAHPGFMLECVLSEDRAILRRALAGQDGSRKPSVEYRMRHRDGRILTMRSELSGCDQASAPWLVRGISLDVTQQKLMEAELQQALKLESVGRLAAGVAHEINTPVQFVNDSCHFLKDGLADFQTLLNQYRETLQALADGGITADKALELMREREATADAGYLMENMPGAIALSLEGLQRVTAIVRSMKEFAHPDQKEKTYADINQAIQSTLTIARNEYKYVADIVTDLGDIPLVYCFLGDLNQAILNIVINAAHAIEDVVNSSGRKGEIGIRTWCEDEDVLIAIRDTGGGIPEDIQGRIFDPFFTTKKVGKGSGQGLAIARSVVDKHQGELRFETGPAGTTFTLRLPVKPRAPSAQLAA